MRKGISFSMTLVVVGVILVITAFGVISMTNEGLGSFFDSISGSQDQQVDSFKVTQACRELAQQIESNYCSQYMPAKYTGPKKDVDSCGARFCTSAEARRYKDTAWDPRDPGCTAQGSSGSTKISNTRVVGSIHVANQTDTYAYLRTGTELECNWADNYGNVIGQTFWSPEVTVEGNTYNCLDRQVFQDQVCPIE